MNKTVNEIRLFLFTCSGEDNFILKRCKKRIQIRFAFIGFFVVLIFVGCFFSATCFAYSLFEGAKWISGSIGVFWGAMVVNMYLLLLHTISPAIIPLASKKKRRKNPVANDNVENSSFLSLSMFSRLGFMMLLAIIIAQPLNVLLLSSTVQNSIEKHKLKERIKLYSMTNKSLIDNELQFYDDFNRKVTTYSTFNENNSLNNQLSVVKNKIKGDSIFLSKTSLKFKNLNKIDENLFLNRNQQAEKKKLLNDLENLLNNELFSDQNFLDNLLEITVSSNAKNEFDTFKTDISKLIQDKINNYNALNNLLDRSNFYIKTIQLLLIENPFSWIITVIISLIFLVPIGLKYYARNISAKMFLENNKNAQLIKLREELINTKDFNWLEKEIKSKNINDIKTSDYYFQRMLIEHKIILEEYDDTKKKFSELLTNNIKKYNRNSQERLKTVLEKLKKLNSTKYNDFLIQISQEYKNDVMVKYEYWLDCPFRTKRMNMAVIVENQVGLLDFLYNIPEEEPENEKLS
ncbi:DUF4407 domain-containing protein [Flavobacterium sp.]|uniref:DUF4407 domain-containing protein n=1 Tax=Flavobacterium sp. TaxID=239 RepID=UPI003D6B353F